MHINVVTPLDFPAGEVFIIATLREFPPEREGGNYQKEKGETTRKPGSWRLL